MADLIRMKDIRPGNRGGAGLFQWDSVKTDKHRENYLGHSVMAPVGRWQKGKDLHWYTKQGVDKRSVAEIAAEEKRLLKEEEEQRRLEALGLAPKRDRKKSDLDLVQKKNLFEKGALGRDPKEKEGERISGLGHTQAFRHAIQGDAVAREAAKVENAIALANLENEQRQRLEHQRALMDAVNGKGPMPLAPAGLIPASTELVNGSSASSSSSSAGAGAGAGGPIGPQRIKVTDTGSGSDSDSDSEDEEQRKARKREKKEKKLRKKALKAQKKAMKEKERRGRSRSRSRSRSKGRGSSDKQSSKAGENGDRDHRKSERERSRDDRDKDKGKADREPAAVDKDGAKRRQRSRSRSPKRRRPGDSARSRSRSRSRSRNRSRS